MRRVAARRRSPRRCAFSSTRVRRRARRRGGARCAEPPAMQQLAAPLAQQQRIAHCGGAHTAGGRTRAAGVALREPPRRRRARRVSVCAHRRCVRRKLSRCLDGLPRVEAGPLRTQGRVVASVCRKQDPGRHTREGSATHACISLIDRASSGERQRRRAMQLRRRTSRARPRHAGPARCRRPGCGRPSRRTARLEGDEGARVSDAGLDAPVAHRLLAGWLLHPLHTRPQATCGGWPAAGQRRSQVQKPWRESRDARTGRGVAGRVARQLALLLLRQLQACEARVVSTSRLRALTTRAQEQLLTAPRRNLAAARTGARQAVGGGGEAEAAGGQDEARGRDHDLRRRCSAAGKGAGGQVVWVTRGGAGGAPGSWRCRCSRRPRG